MPKLLNKFASHLSFILFIVFITLGSASTLYAANFTVGTATELITAITTANSNGESDIITLTANITLISVENSTDGRNGLPSIVIDGGNSITIDGAGFSIQRSSSLSDCDGSDSTEEFRIFHVASGGDLILDNVRIENGCANDAVAINSTGGGIYSSRGTVSIINNSVIQDNASGAGGASNFGGGGVANDGGILTITNSTITDNYSNNDGAGVWVRDATGVFRFSL